jgi:hypothetical protein
MRLIWVSFKSMELFIFNMFLYICNTVLPEVCTAEHWHFCENSRIVLHILLVHVLCYRWAFLPQFVSSAWVFHLKCNIFYAQMA